MMNARKRRSMARGILLFSFFPFLFGTFFLSCITIAMRRGLEALTSVRSSQAKEDDRTQHTTVLSLLRRNITVLHICTAFLMIASAISNTRDGSCSHTSHFMSLQKSLTSPFLDISLSSSLMALRSRVILHASHETPQKSSG